MKGVRVQETRPMTDRSNSPLTDQRLDDLRQLKAGVTCDGRAPGACRALATRLIGRRRLCLQCAQTLIDDRRFAEVRHASRASTGQSVAALRKRLAF